MADFDNNIFIEGTCKNTTENGSVIGYEVQTHIPYYRGIPLSMVNDILVTTDDVPVARQDIRCSVDDGEYWFTLDEMTTVIEHKWEFGQPMTVRILKEGGLSSGTHKVKLDVLCRTAYVPFPLEGVKERLVEIA